MSDAGRILEQLTRIEAKIDTLTAWSGMVDADGRPLTKAEKAEIDRLTDERCAEYERHLRRLFG